MSDLNCEDCYGFLSVDSVDLSTVDWCLPDLSPLWAGPDRRGADVMIPHLSAWLPQIERATLTHYSLRLIVSGHDDQEALEDSWAYLMTNCLLPVDTGDGTRSVVWTLPSGDTRTADAHVACGRSVVLGVGAILRTTIELTVPDSADFHV